MLRLSGLRISSARALHTSHALQAPKTTKVKAVAQGFKKGGEGKRSKKQAGSFRFFQEHVHAGKFNTKAPELSNIGSLEGELKVGEVVGFSDGQLKKLILSGSFKKDQFNELFQKPISLIREETKQIESFLNKATESPSTENRICLIGDRGIGKSALLTQAEAILCNRGDSIILPIPYALKLVDGSNDYLYDRASETYTQPMYLKKFLSRVLKVNKDQLATLKLSKEYQIESPLKNRQPLKFNTENTLLDLLEAKAFPRQRGSIFQILIDELSAQSSKPVFLIVDNFSALTSNTRTQYRNADAKNIKVDQLQISKTVLQFSSGARSFPKGGVILATSSDDKPSITLQAGLGLISPDPYTKSSQLDKDIAAQLQGVKPFHVGKLSKENVSSLVSALIEADAFTKRELETSTKEEIVNNRYVLSGNGNPLELIRSVAMFY